MAELSDDECKTLQTTEVWDNSDIEHFPVNSDTREQSESPLCDDYRNGKSIQDESTDGNQEKSTTESNVGAYQDFNNETETKPDDTKLNAETEFDAKQRTPVIKQKESEVSNEVKNKDEEHDLGIGNGGENELTLKVDEFDKETQNENVEQFDEETQNENVEHFEKETQNENEEHQQSDIHKKSKRKKSKSKHTAKVSPETMKSEEEEISVLETTDMKPEDNRGSELLFATKNKKKAVALKLVEDGADIHFLDQTKCNVLHYAAVAGYDDLIIKLISIGANVKSWDCNGETPLHKASRTGHYMAVVILVTNGADIHALNWEGKNSLELAVQRKHVKVIETLCLFGADLLMQEWTWLEDAMNSKDKTDKAIVDIMKRQYDRLPGFKHGGISQSVKHVTEEKECQMKNLGITLANNEMQQQSPFFFYCCKLHAEYTDFKKILTEDQDLFSDVFECRTWQSPYKVHTLHFKLKGVPKCNETIDIVSPDGKIGRVESIERDEEKNVTEITATISIKHNLSTTFMFVTVKKPEVFAVTKEAVHIQPQMEPDAEIDIPEDTFDSPGDLLFNVVETKDVNVEDSESKEDPVLVTNVLDLSMSNKQQPKRPIDMKLPMHSELDQDAEVAILSSSKEFPEELEDWEIVDAKKDPRRKCAAFKIRHFSIFTGVSKKKLDKDMEAVTKLIQKALNHERQVEFFVNVLRLPGNEFAAVLECALQRKAKKRKKYWEKKNYELQDETISHTIQVNQWFKVQFSGNIKRVGTEQTEADKMMFQPNRDNFKIFNLQVVDTKYPPIGRVQISLIEEQQQDPIRVVENINCIKSKETFIPREPLIDYFDLTTLPVELNPLPSDDGDEPGEEKATDPDYQCTINVLKLPYLSQQLGNRLSANEAHHLAIQLKVPDITELIEEYPQFNNFLAAMLLKWRGKRPYSSQVDILARALDGMGKQYEADEIKRAHLESRPAHFIQL